MVLCSYHAVANETIITSSDPGSEVTFFGVQEAGLSNDLDSVDGIPCQEIYGCASTSVSISGVSDFNETDYPTALSLGTYGPMKIKFTGKRVKFKVRF